MINRLYIDNFKSLVEFELPLSQFTCLIGLNGSGKSTVLQALDFTSAVMMGEVKSWLSDRKWQTKELNSRLVKRSNIELEIELTVDGRDFLWKGTFNRGKLCCTAEKITDMQTQERLFSLKDGRYILGGSSTTETVHFDYQGSLLSQLKTDLLTEEVKAVKDRICALRSLDLLSPESLRRSTRKTERQDIGMGGEQLSAFLHQLTESERNKLLSQLQSYYPQIASIHTKAQRSGWIQLEVKEHYRGKDGDPITLESEARHVNDGMLRLLAILAQQFSALDTLLFDEIENGINPEITEKIVDALVESPRQIIVSTHSPMVLNYLEDQIAQKSVVMLYKRTDGQTRAVRFFDLPTPARKLKTLAPGDAMLDIYLQQAAEEAEALP